MIKAFCRSKRKEISVAKAIYYCLNKRNCENLKLSFYRRNYEMSKQAKRAMYVS